MGACVYGVGACVYGNPMILVSAQVPLVLGLGLRVWGLGLTKAFRTARPSSAMMDDGGMGNLWSPEEIAKLPDKEP